LNIKFNANLIEKHPSMTIRLPHISPRVMEQVEIPIQPIEADVLNQYIDGMRRVRDNRFPPREPADHPTTQILGVELRDDHVQFNYRKDCCLTDDILETLNAVVREIDRKYILRMQELNGRRDESDAIGIDSQEINWRYGNFRTIDRGRPAMETAPMVTDRIIIEWQVQQTGESPDTALTFEIFQEFSDIIKKSREERKKSPFSLWPIKEHVNKHSGTDNR
jgi:hypothetical protein